MDNIQNQLSELRKKIEAIINKQQTLNDEVVQLMTQFDKLNEQAEETTIANPVF